MGACDFEQKIITPDGEQFLFSGPRIVPGTVDLDWPLEGEGLPPIENLSQEIYGMPGALYKGTVVKPRLLTITATAHGLTPAALMDIKARMQGALRWDRSDRGDPSIYRFTMNGVSRDLYVRYDSSVERRLGRPGHVAVVALRMIAFDPLWYDPNTEEQVLDFSDSLAVTRTARRINGLWSNMNGGLDNTPYDAIYHSNGYVYAVGAFHNAGGVPALHIARYDPVANTWAALGAGLDDVGLALREGPDGRIYIAGWFHNAGGGAANHVVVYDPVTGVFSALGVGVDDSATCVTVGADGQIYFGGAFHNAGGAGAAHVAAWNPGTVAWSALGAGTDASVEALVRGFDGRIYAGGTFLNAGGAGAVRMAVWYPVAATWAPLGSGVDNSVWYLAMAADGTLYAGGSFHVAGGNAAMHIARWNGSTWSPLTSGTDNVVYDLVVSPDGILYVGGIFTSAGGVSVYDRMACWNGFAWFGVDGDLPGAAQAEAFVFIGGDEHDMVIAFSTAGTGTVSGAVTATNHGSAPAYPIIRVYNQGTLQSIQNETADYRINFNLYINDGEIVTIDLSAGEKSVGSNWRPNLLGYVLPNSDLATFVLESDPRATGGANIISAFMTGTAAREHNDGGNQLSGWDRITGVNSDNTNNGILYASIVAGAQNRVDFFSDAARTVLVGHTNNYAAAGPVAVNEDNGSGLGGTLTVDAGGWPGANDVDIFVYFTLCEMSWHDRWWDLDRAVS